MSITTDAVKFVKLQNYSSQSKEKNRSTNNVVEADSNSSVRNNFSNLIDRTEHINAKCDYPSTSSEIYGRCRMLTGIHSAKHSTPTTYAKHRLAVKPLFVPLLSLKLSKKRPFPASELFVQGRTPEREQIDNLREELHGIKRNYAALLKENIVLKTRIKRLSNEITKKDRQLQELLFIQSKCYVSDGQRDNMLPMKHKITMLESLLKEKINEKSRVRSDPRRLSKRQRASGNSSTEKLRETLSILEKENDRMRSKLQIFFNCSSFSADALSAFEREELIALIIRLKNELIRKERWKDSCSAKSKGFRPNDTSAMYNHRVVPVKHEFENPQERLRIKNKLIALSDGTEEQLIAEAVKIHCDDEARGTAENAMKMTDSPKVVAEVVVKEGELDADDWESVDSHASIPHGVMHKTKAESIIKRQRYSVNGTKSMMGQTEDEHGVDGQNEHESEVIQSKWKKCKDEKDDDSENRSDEHPFTENSGNKCKKIFRDVANRKLVNRNSSDCSEVQQCAEVEDSSGNTQQQLRKMAQVKKREGRRNEVKFENTERVESKQDEITPNFFFRSILQTTSAHLKRLELLIAKTSFSSSCDF